MCAKNFWLAFGIGVVAGAGVALLWAPNSGAKTRRQLRKGIEDAGDCLGKAADEMKSQVEKIGSGTQEAVGRARAYVEDVVDSAADLAAAVSKSARSLV